MWLSHKTQRDIHLKDGSATRDSQISAVEITQQFRLLYHLSLFFHARLANPPIMTGVALCHENVGCP